MPDVARIEGGLDELGAAVERDRLLWRARVNNVERAVEQTLQLAQEIRSWFAAGGSQDWLKPMRVV